MNISILEIDPLTLNQLTNTNGGRSAPLLMLIPMYSMSPSLSPLV